VTVKLSLENLHKKFLNKFCKEIPLNLNYNCKYNEKQILGPIVYASVENVYLETLNDELENKPNSDSNFYHLKRLNWKEILGIIQNMIKENYLKLRRMYRLIGKQKIAIDFHDIPYYGKDKCLFIVRGKQKNGTTRFYRIISVDIVERGRRFTLAVIPMNTFKSKRKVVEDLINKLKRVVKIHCILMDRGFQSIDVYKSLTNMEKRWVTPVKKSAKIMRIMDECAKNDIWKTMYRLQCNKNFIDIKLLIYPTKDGDLVGFFTNMNVEPDWVARTYPERWGIETGYRVKKEFRAKTCSRSFVVRLFFILLSVILYNFWVSLNVESYLLNEKTLTVRKVRITFRRIIETDII
jgi:hypothetical protein